MEHAGPERMEPIYSLIRWGSPGLKFPLFTETSPRAKKKASDE